MSGELIEEFWVCVALNDHGEECVVGSMDDDGVWMPLFATGPATLESIKKRARRIVASSKRHQEIAVLRFSNRETLERIVAESGETVSGNR